MYKGEQMEMREFLLNNGWRHQERDAFANTIYYKTFPELSEKDCECNEKPPQIVITEFVQNDIPQYELDLRAEYGDGEWVKLQIYAIETKNLQKTLDTKVRSLYNMWNKLAAERCEG